MADVETPDPEVQGLLAGPLAALGAPGPVRVLAARPGRRVVARAGDLVIKAFAPAEAAAWAREEAGLRALGGTGLAVALVASGERWTATRWSDGVPPGDDAHRALGATLARLHRVAPEGLRPWPVAERLRARLTEPPEACPRRLVEAIAARAEAFLHLPTRATFVHGDWGTSNVLCDRHDPDRLLVLDLEDAHVGDPAEDFRWQVLAGPSSSVLRAMGRAYAEAGGALGADARERLLVAGADLCLEALGWSGASSRLRRRCVATLERLARGELPVPPAP